MRGWSATRVDARSPGSRRRCRCTVAGRPIIRAARIARERHQEAIEYFENQFDEPDFDPTQWLDIALYYSPAVARGIIDLVTADDKARSNIAEVIADNLDISYGADECQQFAETIQFALANGVPVDLDVVLDGCMRAIDDLDTWADDDVKEPLVRLREEVLRLQGEH